MSFSWWPPDGPFPNTPGGIRGPDGKTLTDLYNQAATANAALAAMAASLSAMALDTVQIRDDLRRLVGLPADAPATWKGFPYNYTFTVAPPSETSSNWLRSHIAGVNANLVTLMSHLTASGIAGPPFTSTLKPMLDMYIAEAANRSTARFAIEALAAAVGSLGSDPADMTVKQLLAAIELESARAADCCEEANSEEPPPTNPLNGQPGGVCGDFSYGPARNSSLVLANDPLPHASAGFDAYAVLWDNIGTFTSGGVLRDFPTQTPSPNFWGNYQNASWDFCFGWDMTDNNAPALASLYLYGNQDFWPASGGTGNNLSPLTYPIGQVGFSVSANIRWALIIAVPEGSDPPNNNFWLAAEPSAA